MLSFSLSRQGQRQGSGTGEDWIGQGGQGGTDGHFASWQAGTGTWLWETCAFAFCCLACGGLLLGLEALELKTLETFCFPGTCKKAGGEEEGEGEGCLPSHGILHPPSLRLNISLSQTFFLLSPSPSLTYIPSISQRAWWSPPPCHPFPCCGEQTCRKEEGEFRYTTWCWWRTPHWAFSCSHI